MKPTSSSKLKGFLNQDISTGGFVSGFCSKVTRSLWTPWSGQRRNAGNAALQLPWQQGPPWAKARCKQAHLTGPECHWKVILDIFEPFFLDLFQDHLQRKRSQDRFRPLIFTGRDVRDVVRRWTCPVLTYVIQSLILAAVLGALMIGLWLNCTSSKNTMDESYHGHCVSIRPSLHFV